MRAGKMRWIAAIALIFTAGCMGMHTYQPRLSFVEMPPAVRAAFLANYPDARICAITCEAHGGQYYYIVNYNDSRRHCQTVVLNEGGDEIDRY